MSTPDPSHHQPVESERLLAELRERWMAQYGPRVAAELEPDRRYSLVRVGSAEYAFTEYDRFVRALHHTWDSQLVPEHLPSVTGSELLDVAPNLQAVDPDLDDLPELGN
jgi:hypothetical protein